MAYPKKDATAPGVPENIRRTHASKNGTGKQVDSDIWQVFVWPCA